MPEKIVVFFVPVLTVGARSRLAAFKIRDILCLCKYDRLLPGRRDGRGRRLRRDGLGVLARLSLDVKGGGGAPRGQKRLYKHRHFRLVRIVIEAAADIRRARDANPQ